MNFLTLCQRAAVDCGVASRSAILTVLPTTANATGSLGRIVNWVGDSWNDLQTQHDDWDWMRSSVLIGGGASFETVAGQATYPLGDGDGTVGISEDSFGKWDRRTFRCYTTTVGFTDEMSLDELTYDAWRDAYMYGAQRLVKTRPVAVAVGPDQSVCLGPPPTGSYTVTADYWVGPSEMEADTDVPVGLPTRFHLLIVYKTMIKYAGYESAPEVYQRGTAEWDRMYRKLTKARAPEISFGGALA